MLGQGDLLITVFGNGPYNVVTDFVCIFHALFYYACKARWISNIERNAVLIKERRFLGAAFTEAVVTKHAHCILGAAFPSMGVICNNKILPNKMCYFAFFWLLKICVVDVISWENNWTLKYKPAAACRQPDSNTYLQNTKHSMTYQSALYRYSSFIYLSHRLLPPAAHNVHAAERRDLHCILQEQFLTSCVVTSLAPSRPLISVTISAFFFHVIQFSNSRFSISSWLAE